MTDKYFPQYGLYRGTSSRLDSLRLPFAVPELLAWKEQMSKRRIRHFQAAVP
jgi:hypothetical protein